MKRAVRKLRSGKARGVCCIQEEMVKAGGHTMVQWLKEVLDVAWKSGKTPPQEWREAIIIPIPKKGCKAECGNFRGISLLSVVGKVYARIVSDRVKVLTDELVMDHNQFAYIETHHVQLAICTLSLRRPIETMEG